MKDARETVKRAEAAQSASEELTLALSKRVKSINTALTGVHGVCDALADAVRQLSASTDASLVSLAQQQARTAAHLESISSHIEGVGDELQGLSRAQRTIVPVLSGAIQDAAHRTQMAVQAQDPGNRQHPVPASEFPRIEDAPQDTHGPVPVHPPLVARTSGVHAQLPMTEPQLRQLAGMVAEALRPAVLQLQPPPPPFAALTPPSTAPPEGGAGALGSDTDERVAALLAELEAQGAQQAAEHRDMADIHGMLQEQFGLLQGLSATVASLQETLSNAAIPAAAPPQTESSEAAAQQRAEEFEQLQAGICSVVREECAQVANAAVRQGQGLAAAAVRGLDQSVSASVETAVKRGIAAVQQQLAASVSAAVTRSVSAAVASAIAAAGPRGGEGGLNMDQAQQLQALVSNAVQDSLLSVLSDPRAAAQIGGFSGAHSDSSSEHGEPEQPLLLSVGPPGGHADSDTESSIPHLPPLHSRAPPPSTQPGHWTTAPHPGAGASRAFEDTINLSGVSNVLMEDGSSPPRGLRFDSEHSRGGQHNPDPPLPTEQAPASAEQAAPIAPLAAPPMGAPRSFVQRQPSVPALPVERHGVPLPQDAASGALHSSFRTATSHATDASVPQQPSVPEDRSHAAASVAVPVPSSPAPSGGGGGGGGISGFMSGLLSGVGQALFDTSSEDDEPKRLQHDQDEHGAAGRDSAAAADTTPLDQPAAPPSAETAPAAGPQAPQERTAPRRAAKHLTVHPQDTSTGFAGEGRTPMAPAGGGGFEGGGGSVSGRSSDSRESPRGASHSSVRDWAPSAAAIPREVYAHATSPQFVWPHPAAAPPPTQHAPPQTGPEQPGDLATLPAEPAGKPEEGAAVEGGTAMGGAGPPPAPPSAAQLKLEAKRMEAANRKSPSPALGGGTHASMQAVSSPAKWF